MSPLRSASPRSLVCLALIGALVGCDPEPLPPGQYTVTDRDTDGYPASVDCDDDDKAVNPGADERCGDAVDNDCDGEVDEPGAVDASVFYADFDADGFGVFAYTVSACEAPDGYSEQSGDCDDFNPDVNPLATEVCNGLDDDCDDVVDGAYAEGQNTYYRDADADGFGDPDAMQDGCEAPVGYSPEVGDCDDSDPDTYEGAPELCDDVDNDCNGFSDETCPQYLSTAANLLFTSEATYDRAGDALHAGGDLNGDGFADLVIGAAENDLGSLNGGSAFIYYGPLSIPEDTEGAEPAPMSTQLDIEDSADAIVLGASSSDYAGSQVQIVPDLNGDGIGELLVGAPLAGGDNHGEAYLFFGPLTAGATPTNVTGADARFHADPGEDVGDFSKYVMRAAGDLDDDGVVDLVIGDNQFEGPSGLDNVGRVYLYSGTSVGDVQVDEAFATITGHVERANLAYSASAPLLGSELVDFNADGVSDLAIGAPGEDEVWVYYGPLAGDLGRDDADVLFSGSEGDWLGSKATAGDTNNDGYADLALGAYYDDGGGSRSGDVYVFEGPLETDVSYSSSTPFGDFATWEMDVQVYLGSQTNGMEITDVDGDGFGDLMVGSSQNSDLRDDAGAVFVFFGPLSGRRGGVWEADRTFRGDGNRDNAGYALGAADMDGDGINDVVVGAEGWSVDQGAVGIFQGKWLY